MMYQYDFLILGRDLEKHSGDEILRHDKDKAAHALGTLIIENVGLKMRFEPDHYAAGAGQQMPNNRLYSVTIQAFSSADWDIFCQQILNCGGAGAQARIREYIMELEAKTIKKPVNDTQTA